MKISRRMGLSLLLLAVLVSMFMQYPMFKVHSGNWDNHFILLSSKTISSKGYAPWIGNWASYFGLHRTSYPQGTPFFLSSFQQISGWNSELLVLIYSYMISTMAVILSFIVGLLIRKKDHLFAFFIAFLFSTSPSYLYVTEWTASARGIFVSILPFLVILNLMLLKKDCKSRGAILFLNVFVFVLAFSLHRLSFFILVTLLPAFLISYFLFAEGKYLGIFWDIWRRNVTKRKIISIIISLFIIYFVYIFYSQETVISKIYETYSSSKLLSGYSPVVRFINIALGILASVGPLSIFIFLPIKEQIGRKKINTETSYFLINLFFLIFIILYPMYFRPYAALFLSGFIAFFLIYTLYGHNRASKTKIPRLSFKIVAAMLVFSMVFSSVLQAEWDGVLFQENKQWMDYEQEEVVTTISTLPGDNVFVVGELRRLSSLESNKFVMPPGGYRYDLCFYLFANRPDMFSPEDLNLKFSPYVFWSGKLYLYSENINVSDRVDPIYHLKYYDVFETDDSFPSMNSFSNKNITEYNYILYSRDKYHLYMVDLSNPDVYETKVYFSRP